MYEPRQEIWLNTPKGKGTVLFVHDVGQEAPLYFTVIIRATGELWTYPQHAVRACQNITLGGPLNPASVQQTNQ